MWLTQKMQYIKQGMTTLLANFSKSGSIYTHAMYAASHHIMCLIPNQETLKMAWMTLNVTCSSGKSFATGRQNGFGFTCVGSVGEKYHHGALLFFPTNGAWMLGLKMKETEPMRCELCHNFIVCDASYVRSCNQVQPHPQQHQNTSDQGLQAQLYCKLPHLTMIFVPCFKLAST